MDDPVLSLFVQPLHEHGYYVLRYNSRSVGKSSGWPSMTGAREAQDLRELVRWAADLITSVRSVVVIGYSYGALIASLLPLSPELKISHVLLSYPQGPRHWLTAFHGRMYDTALNSLLHDPQSNVLVLYGDHDEFTSVEAYDIWTTTLLQQAGNRRNHSIVKIVNGTHFWREFEPMNKMVDTRNRTIMPLPDERPRQSVANLIGRFEQQNKRQSVTASGLPRTSSTASLHADAAKEEIKEKREWPPKPKPMVPSDPAPSSREDTAAKEQAQEPSQSPSPPPVPKSPPEKVTVEPEPEPSAAAEPTHPLRPKRKRFLFLNPSLSGSLVWAPSSSRTPASSPTKMREGRPSTISSTKSAGRTPAKSPPSSFHSAVSTSASTPSSHPPKAPAIAKVAPSRSRPSSRASGAMTPVRSKTPSGSRPKTPSLASSPRPKVSSGLFAPTAASLAKARNSEVPPPPPVRKHTAGPDTFERLSKPTAASISKARTTPVSSPAKGARAPARGAAPTRGTATVKPRVGLAGAKLNTQKRKVAPKAAAAAAKTKTTAAAPEAEYQEAEHHEELPVEAEDHDHEGSASTLVDEPEHSESHEAEAVQQEESVTGDEDDHVTPASPSHSDPGSQTNSGSESPDERDASMVETEAEVPHEGEHDASKVETEAEAEVPHEDETDAIVETLDHAKKGDYLADMVNFLESNPRPTSIALIPDEIADIPDED
ncbi:hypothetical protein A0H81_08049 [Grifola frondosa]|uniref:Xaa-Pro dipeptidyl-peptidase-like domain-containing protein n=1 Tax=Grifola frondosa TaxID=5627 RepID=A0A1C7M6G3_GRIFR|nr:hypothetical protein A0H81_08049 [Grifola frondosa]